MLETRVERVEADDPSAEKVRKISRMATELLAVMQEKEDDIRNLLEKVETKAEEKLATPSKPERQYENIRQFDVRNEREKSSYSSSELHTIEMLKARRQA